MIWLSTCQISQAPCSFKLNLWEISSLKELDELGDKVGINNLLNWRIYFLRKKSSVANGGKNLLCLILVINTDQKLVEIILVEGHSLSLKNEVFKRKLINAEDGILN